MAILEFLKALKSAVEVGTTVKRAEKSITRPVWFVVEGNLTHSHAFGMRTSFARAVRSSFG